MAMRLKYASLAEEVTDVKRKRGWLLESLRTYLVPALAEQGFASVAPVLHGPTDREHKETFPFGSFIRKREHSVDSVEIQLAPHRADYFRINAGVRSNEGLVTVNGHEAFDASLAPWSQRFEMLANPRLWWLWSWSWFTVHPRFRKPAPADYDRLALHVAG